jgi:hypothetical protein
MKAGLNAFIVDRIKPNNLAERGPKHAAVLDMAESIQSAHPSRSASEYSFRAVLRAFCWPALIVGKAGGRAGL